MKFSLSTLVALASLCGLAQAATLRGVEEQQQLQPPQSHYRKLQTTTAVTQELDFEDGVSSLDFVSTVVPIGKATDPFNNVGFAVTSFQELGYFFSVGFLVQEATTSIELSDAIIGDYFQVNDNALRVKWCDGNPLTANNPSCVFDITLSRVDGEAFLLDNLTVAANTNTCAGDASGTEAVIVRGGFENAASIPSVNSTNQVKQVVTGFTRKVTEYTIAPLLQQGGCFALLDLQVTKFVTVPDGDDPDVGTDNSTITAAPSPSPPPVETGVDTTTPIFALSGNSNPFTKSGAQSRISFSYKRENGVKADLNLILNVRRVFTFRSADLSIDSAATTGSLVVFTGKGRASNVDAVLDFTLTVDTDATTVQLAFDGFDSGVQPGSVQVTNA